MKIGIAGLGDMGAAMMDRLLAAKRDAYGYNRTKSKAEPFIARGMTLAGTPRALAQSCDVVISMVTDDRALEAIAGGDDGLLRGLSEGKIWIDLSTVSPDAIRAMNDRVRETGAQLLDGSVLGSPQTIAQGKLLTLLAGDAAVCERVTPALHDIGPNVRRVGDVGHAKVMKLALLAEKSGIDRKTALDIMLGGVVASPMLQYRAPFIVNPPEKAWFDMTMMQKDVRLALDLANDVAMPLPTTSVANDMLSAARAQGLEHKDFAELFHALARMSGVS